MKYVLECVNCRVRQWVTYFSFFLQCHRYDDIRICIRISFVQMCRIIRIPRDAMSHTMMTNVIIVRDNFPLNHKFDFFSTIFFVYHYSLQPRIKSREISLFTSSYRSFRREAWFNCIGKISKDMTARDNQQRPFKTWRCTYVYEYMPRAYRKCNDRKKKSIRTRVAPNHASYVRHASKILGWIKNACFRLVCGPSRTPLIYTCLPVACKGAHTSTPTHTYEHTSV